MNKTVRIDLIIIFFVIAVGLSMFFRVPQFNPSWYDSLREYRFGWILVSLLRASGPLTGGIICIWFFRKKYERTITFLGTSVLISLLYFFAPVVMITLMGIDSGNGDNVHYYGLLSGLTLMLYCIFEETGWRGYLQDAMRGVPNPLRFIIIGTLWYCWHLNFLSPELHSIKFGLLIHLPSCILGSWIIGYMADKYKSLMVAAAIHCIFNIFFDLGTDMRSKFIIAAGVFLVWIAASKVLDKVDKTTVA